MHKVFLYLFSFSLLFSACIRNEEYTAPTPGGPSAISGTIIAQNEFQRRLTTQPNIRVILTTLTDGQSYPATADTAGKFRIENVPAGTYKIVYEADDFPTYTNPLFTHNGGTEQVLDPQFMHQRSSSRAQDRDPASNVRTLITETPYRTLITLQPNQNFDAVGAPNYVVRLRLETQGGRDVIVRDTFNYQQDTTFTFAEVTRLEVQAFLRQVAIVATLIGDMVQIVPPSLVDGTVRGLMFYASTSPDVSSENYLIKFPKLYTNSVSTDTTSLKFSGEQLQSFGLITPTNRKFYFTTYGISGKNFFQGSYQLPDSRIVTYPGLNPNKSRTVEVNVE